MLADRDPRLAAQVKHFEAIAQVFEAIAQVFEVIAQVIESERSPPR